MGTNVWKIVLAVLAVAVVVVLIAVPTALFLNEKKEDPQRTFTLNDYFNTTIRARSFNLRWLSDIEYLHKTPEGSVLLFTVPSENGQEFLSRQPFDRVEAFDYMVSADRKFVCFLSNYTKLWRHSYMASYSIYDQENGTFITADIPHEVQYLAWSPTGHKLAYVWMYNVYVKDSPTAPSQQVTFNGAHNKILNGIPDWVYEEEMFSTNHALWWSPTGRYLAFAEFNDTNVHTIEYSWYGEGQYPEMVVIPYPKAGTPNPTVRLFVADATNVSRITEVVVPSAVGEGEHYLSTVTWATDERIAVQWQNRTQSYLTLQLYELNGDTWRETTREEESEKARKRPAKAAERRRKSLYTHTRLHTGIKMKGTQFLAGLLLLFFVHSSLELPLKDVTSSETEARVWEERKDFPLVKRHSEGTFSNDYSKYLETQRAQDFVQWLMNSKRSGGPVRRHADGTYTSDVSAYLQDQAAKDFITWLKSGQPKQE
ncbi:hypothetical protein MHYP_G00301770 [Metynnis hypsauchen]